jgi:hypothetical protein
VRSSNRAVGRLELPLWLHERRKGLFEIIEHCSGYQGELIHVQVFEACVVVAVRLAGLAVQARRYRGTASASQDFEKHFARCAVSIPLGPVQRSRATALCCRANGRASWIQAVGRARRIISGIPFSPSEASREIPNAWRISQRIEGPHPRRHARGLGEHAEQSGDHPSISWRSVGGYRPECGSRRDLGMESDRACRA